MNAPLDHRALQRALVILSYDPAFSDLAALGLGAREQAELERVDRRALKLDPLRRMRLLRTLAEEYKASTTLLLAETRSLAGLAVFFESTHFRRAVRTDEALALAFGEFLGEAAQGAKTEPLVGVLGIEATRARSRREAQRPARPGLSLAPGVACVAVDRSALPAIQAVERYLFEVGLMPQIALAQDAPRLAPLGPLAGEDDYFLFQPAEGEIALSPVDEGLYRVLACFAEPTTRRDAPTRLERAAVPARAAAALVESLLAEGLLAEGAGAQATRSAST